MENLENIIDSIHRYLSNHASCTEHGLIQHLKTKACAPYDTLSLNHSKDLFDAHFLTRHALYKLQQRYFADKAFTLELTLTRITRHPYKDSNDTSLNEHDAVRDYYLDIRHYLETKEDEVNALLKRFWEKYLAQEDRSKALMTLKLPADADYETVKAQYRKLAQMHHPDKGGCAKTFSDIADAKATLDKRFSIRK